MKTLKTNVFNTTPLVVTSVTPAALTIISSPPIVMPIEPTTTWNSQKTEPNVAYSILINNDLETEKSKKTVIVIKIYAKLGKAEQQLQHINESSDIISKKKIRSFTSIVYIKGNTLNMPKPFIQQ
jgi:hypothetical protein